MDDIVRQAMAKWPRVPACYGWLGLDARGRWYLRDDAVQAAGVFPHCKGDGLEHDKLIAFIGRNYACDDRGQWFFQNGPQRVYVELEAAPWVWRMGPGLQLHAHTGAPAVAALCLVDERGWVYLQTDLGLGLVHSQDVALAAQAIEAGVWPVESVRFDQIPARCGFVRSPDAERKKKAGP